VLEIAPSTYYSAKGRPPSARALSDAALMPILLALWVENYSVYGRRKLTKAARKAGHDVGRDQVARLMRQIGIRGASRSRKRFTTKADPAAVRAPDLVNRDFTATGPNQKWVADFTYCSTWSGIVYVAFVVDVFSRRIVGWKAARTMAASLVIDALNMAAWTRRGVDLDGVVCHSDAGSQYTSIAYTDRLAEIDAQPSIGTIGDSYDNALAETTIGLFKTELHRNPAALNANGGPWRGLDDLEIATCGWVSWFNDERIHGELDDLTPPKSRPTTVTDLSPKRHEKPNPTSLHQTQADSMSAFTFRAAQAQGHVASPYATFSDVRQGHPFYEEIDWLVDEGITTGYPDGTFRPGGVVGRGAMAAFLFRLAPLTTIFRSGSAEPVNR